VGKAKEGTGVLAPGGEHKSCSQAAQVVAIVEEAFRRSPEGIGNFLWPWEGSPGCLGTFEAILGEGLWPRVRGRTIADIWGLGMSERIGGIPAQLP